MYDFAQIDVFVICYYFYNLILIKQKQNILFNYILSPTSYFPYISEKIIFVFPSQGSHNSVTSTNLSIQISHIDEKLTLVPNLILFLNNSFILSLILSDEEIIQNSKHVVSNNIDTRVGGHIII